MYIDSAVLTQNEGPFLKDTNNKSFYNIIFYIVWYIFYDRSYAEASHLLTILNEHVFYAYL